ncbi:MAG: hypothetical protein JXA20_20535, partial [Spirochaetes bacterium]|nr:hypothetical protein [Spirochaetota bacterium]
MNGNNQGSAPRRIQFIGCGVIGSILAAKLAAAGAEVTVLARGGRLGEIGEHGVVIRHAITGERIQARVNAIDRPGAGGAFDLTVVPVRADQLDGIIPILNEDAGTGLIVVMVNNPEGIAGTAER